MTVGPKPRALVVENIRLTRERFVRCLREPPHELAMRNGLQGFDLDQAGSAASARRLLHEAAASLRPYEIVVFDLGLPKTDQDNEEDDDVEAGIAVLQEFDWHGYTSLVIVSSHLNDVLALQSLLPIAPVEAVAKPIEPEELFPVVAQVYKRQLERREKDWLATLEKRQEQWQLTQARAQVADQMGRITTNGLGTLLSKADEIVRLMDDRYQLNPAHDPDDPICRVIRDIRQAAYGTSEKLRKVRQDMSSTSETLSSVSLEEVIDAAINKVRSGIVYRRLTLARTVRPCSVHSFRNDLERIIEEMLVNAIAASEEAGTLEVKVAVNKKAQTIEVSVKDRGAPISTTDRQWSSLDSPPNPSQGRLWGLSLANRVADNIGARLSLNAQEGVNIVTLQIPVTADDQIACG